MGKKKKLKQRWTMGEMMARFGISRRRLEYLIEFNKIEPVGFERQKQRIFDRDGFRKLREIIRKMEVS